jgi:hypothetical protein
LASKIDLNRPYPPTSLLSSNYTVSGVYGNGNYITSASSTYLSAYPYYAFKYPSSPMIYFQVGTSNYTGTSGAYAGSVTTVINIVGVPTNYYGEWLQIKLPLNLTIKNYIITGFTSSSTNLNPSAWYLIGSSDGSNWVIVDTRSSITSWSSVSASSFTYTPNGDTSGYTYYRLIITASNGSTSVGVQNLLFYATDGTALTAAISSYGVGIGTTSLTYPIGLHNTYKTQLLGAVGIGTTPDPTGVYSVDIAAANGVRIRTFNSGAGYVILTGGPASTTVGYMSFYSGAGSNCGWVGLCNYITGYIDLATVAANGYSGYYMNGKLLVNQTAGIGTQTINASATLDVGGASTSTFYTYLNGLRISGRDPNTIWQDISTSNINITTSGTNQNIYVCIIFSRCFKSLLLPKMRRPCLRSFRRPEVQSRYHMKSRYLIQISYKKYMCNVRVIV